VVKLLFPRGEDEIRTAVDALENPILKFDHGTILELERGNGCLRFPCYLRNADSGGAQVPKKHGQVTQVLPFSEARSLFDLPAALLPVTLPGESCCDALFFSWLQIERMPLDLFYDVFLLHFSFEAPEGIF
jgi:hypothetical protein